MIYRFSHENKPSRNKVSVIITRLPSTSRLTSVVINTAVHIKQYIGEMESRFKMTLRVILLSSIERKNLTRQIYIAFSIGNKYTIVKTVSHLTVQ